MMNSMRVLIATGGAPHSTIAVKLGALWAQMFPAQVTVLTVVKAEKFRPEGTAVLTAAEAILRTAVPNLALQTRMRVGQAAEEIVHEAADGRYHLVILGEKQHHDLLSRVLGPTAERVIHHVSCPVLIAKKGAHTFDHLLLCDSGAPQRSLLRRLQAMLPQLLTAVADVTILHVMSQISAGPGINGGELRADAAALMEAHTPEGDLLAQDMRQLALEGVKAQPKVRHGLVVHEILAEAASGNYDLLVIGAHRNGGWQRFLLDDLAQQIVLGADRPVLVIV